MHIPKHFKIQPDKELKQHISANFYPEFKAAKQELYKAGQNYAALYNVPEPKPVMFEIGCVTEIGKSVLKVKNFEYEIIERETISSIVNIYGQKQCYSNSSYITQLRPSDADQWVPQTTWNLYLKISGEESDYMLNKLVDSVSVQDPVTGKNVVFVYDHRKNQMSAKFQASGMSQVFPLQIRWNKSMIPEEAMSTINYRVTRRDKQVHPTEMQFEGQIHRFLKPSMSSSTVVNSMKGVVGNL